MKRYAILLIALFLTQTACENNKNPVAGNENEAKTFQTTNIKEGAVYFDFVEENMNPVWDLSFNNYNRSPEFYMNPQLLGDEHVMIYVETAPAANKVASVDFGAFTTDQDTAIMGGNWYNYDFATHTLSSKKLQYVLKTATGNIYRFHIDSFAGDVYDLRYAKYDAVADAFGEEMQMAVNQAQGMVLLSFDYGVVEEKAWDVKYGIIPTEIPNAGVFSFPGIMLNQEADVRVRVLTGVEFEDVDVSTVTGLTADTPGVFVIGSEWFDYDPATHRVTSKKDVYVIERADSERYKLQILSYYSESGVSGFISFQYGK